MLAPPRRPRATAGQGADKFDHRRVVRNAGAAAKLGNQDEYDGQSEVNQERRDEKRLQRGTTRSQSGNDSDAHARHGQFRSRLSSGTVTNEMRVTPAVRILSITSNTSP